MSSSSDGQSDEPEFTDPNVDVDYGASLTSTLSTSLTEDSSVSSGVSDGDLVTDASNEFKNSTLENGNSIAEIANCDFN